MQQDLQTDLERGSLSRIDAPAASAAADDAAEALATARKLGATIVVFGQAQYNGTEVRLTGQVLDVASGKPLGSMKATGPLSELFHLEDAIVGQTLAVLPRTILTPAAVAAMSPQPAPQQPSVAVAPQAASTDTAQVNNDVQPAPAPVYYDSNSYDVPVALPVYTAPSPLFTYSYGYGCAVPAYTYACPPCNLFPYCGAENYVGSSYGYAGQVGRRGFDRGRLNHGRGVITPGEGGRVRGGAGNRNGIPPSSIGRTGGGRTPVAGITHIPTGGSHAVNSSRSFSGSRSVFPSRSFSGGFHGGGGGGGGGFHGGGGSRGGRR